MQNPFLSAPISVLVWVRSFIELDVLKTKVPFNNTARSLSDQPALEIRVTI